MAPAKGTSAQVALDETSASLFQREWRTYRKVVDNNYMFHREVYDAIRRVLVEEMPGPFRFLDIGCGDASATVGALLNTSVSHYYGVDLSAPALALARDALQALDCPFTLTRSDFVEALSGWSEPRVDVIWMGQSLHHLQGDAKLAFMRQLHSVLADDGLRFQNVSRPLWSDLTGEEWDAVVEHIRAADHPETAETWLSLGQLAGFEINREIFIAPTRLARVYQYGTA